MDAITGAVQLFLFVLLVMFLLGSFGGTKLLIFGGYLLGGFFVLFIFMYIWLYINETFEENRKKIEENRKISDDRAGDKSRNSGQKLGYKPRDKAKDRLF